MNDLPRDFKGIWIPREVWQDRSLSYFEKCLLSEIHSLDGKDGCFASNEYLCNFFNERERKIQDALANLKAKGYIFQESFDGRTRVLRTNMNPSNDKSLFSTSPLSKSAPLPCRNPHPSRYIENKVLDNTLEQQQQPLKVESVVVVEKEKEKLAAEKENPSLREADIPYENTRGEKKTISQSEIYRYFSALDYGPVVVKEAIRRMTSKKQIINHPLKFLESICRSIAKNPSKEAEYQPDAEEKPKSVTKKITIAEWSENDKKLKKGSKNV